MMGSDARDVMGLPSAGPPKPTPAKTPKPKGRGPTGISREVLDLKYEGAPPISIVAPKFKEKPKLPFKPRQWEETPFRNSARNDGLILKHWRRKGDVGSVGAAMPVTPADSNAASEMETDDKTPATIPDSYWAKYNVKVEKPQYTDEQYETHLKNNDWSKEETDYLVDLVYEFDLRWIIIADRYDYQPKEIPQKTEDAMAASPTAKPRTQEDMKARYYDVAAKTMVLHHPLSSMSSSEFDTHEKMTKYNPVQETQRKKYAEQLMQRTDDEKYEEEMLLKELSRIVNNQEKLFNERKALYDRLEPAANTSKESFSTTMYQTSQGLTQLMQNLLTQNKNKELEKKEKRRSAIEAGDIPAGPDRSHRQSVSGTDKRASLSGESGRRQLSAREETKWGISHPSERLTGGVQFRHERASKASQAKSANQTSKLAAALNELGVAPRLVMPTAKVVTEYENLLEKVKILIDVRKLNDKIDAEIKVWKQHKEQQEAKDRGEEVKEEEGASQQGGGNEEEEEEEASKLEITQDEESKVEEENDNDNENQASEADEEEEDDKNEEKDDSEAEADVDADADADVQNPEEEEGGEEEEEEAENEDESANNSSDNEEADPEAEENGNDENDIASEMRELQEDEEGEAHEQEQGGKAEREIDDDEDIKGVDEPAADTASSPQASPAPAMKSEGVRKRSASVISHISNRSSKRQRKEVK